MSVAVRLATVGYIPITHEPGRILFIQISFLQSFDAINMLIRRVVIGIVQVIQMDFLFLNDVK